MCSNLCLNSRETVPLSPVFWWSNWQMREPPVTRMTKAARRLRGEFSRRSDVCMFCCPSLLPYIAWYLLYCHPSYVQKVCKYKMVFHSYWIVGNAKGVHWMTLFLLLQLLYCYIKKMFFGYFCLFWKWLVVMTTKLKYSKQR